MSVYISYRNICCGNLTASDDRLINIPTLLAIFHFNSIDRKASYAEIVRLRMGPFSYDSACQHFSECWRVNVIDHLRRRSSRKRKDNKL